MSTSRRQFLTGCSAAIAAMAGSRLSSLCFSDGTAPAESEILVVLFLRGGMDGMNLVAPVDDPHYIAARPADLRLLAAGDTPALALKNAPPGFDFRMHPSAKALRELYDGGQLAIVHAAGLTSATRSHFEAMDLMERGVPDVTEQNLASGWLARHLGLLGGNALLPAISTSDAPPASLLGAPSAVAVNDLGGFSFYGDDEQFKTVQSLYEGAGPIHRAGARALAAMTTVKEKLKRNDKGELLPYQPANHVEYPAQGDLSNPLQMLARIIRMNLGLKAAAVDFGGWDTHQNQPGTFTALVEQLSTSLAAFYHDLSDYHQRLTIVTMSEFGRRLKSSQSDGTDHGHGNVLLTLGGNVNGGRIHGTWPGLANEQLDNGADLAITTDYREVLSELIVRRFGQGKLSTVFPGLKKYAPLGIFKGAEGVKTDLG